MNKYLVLLFLVFLVGTSEFQAVSASSAIGAQNVAQKSEVTIESFKRMTTNFMQFYTDLQAKFDKDGNAKVIANYLVPEAGIVGEQSLLQKQKSDKEMILLSSKLFVYASAFLILGTLTMHLKVENAISYLMNRFKKGKDDGNDDKRNANGKFMRIKIGNLFYLISSALWFQGFYYLTQVAINAGVDVRNLAPILLKLMASALFTIQPMTSLLKLNDPSDNAHGDLFYANHFALIFLHIGNMISTAYAVKNINLGDFINPSNLIPKGIPFLIVTGTAFLLSSDPTTIDQLGGVSRDKGIRPFQAIAYPYIGSGCLLIASSYLLYDLTKE